MNIILLHDRYSEAESFVSKLRDTLHVLDDPHVVTAIDLRAPFKLLHETHVQNGRYEKWYLSISEIVNDSASPTVTRQLTTIERNTVKIFIVDATPEEAALWDPKTTFNSKNTEAAIMENALPLNYQEEDTFTKEVIKQQVGRGDPRFKKIDYADPKSVKSAILYIAGMLSTH